jgi:hypothetical protein
MAQPPFLNLNPEDIPKESAEWMSPIIDALNQFAKQVQYGFNKQLSVSDNLKAHWKTVKIQKVPYKFVNDVPYKPMGIFIAACTDVTNPVDPKPFAASGLAYSFSGNDIVIDAIGGANPQHAYNVTFLLIGQ